MASNYLMQAVQEYENFIQVHGIDEFVIDAYLEACKVAINGEKDIEYGLQLTKRSKGIIERFCMDKTGGTIWDLEKYAFDNKTRYDLIDKYYEPVLLEAQNKVVDSYFQYIEKKREPKDRFYMPRRKQLLKIGLVDGLQGMIDDKYNILCISLIPGAGKTTIEKFFATAVIGWYPKDFNLFYSHSGDITRMFYDGTLDIVTNAISTSIYDSFEEEVAVVIMKPYSGKVLCLIGGKNYLQSELDRATSSYFQIGSTIKPILYYLGMCSGMTPLSTFKSEKTDFYIKDIGLYSPKNSNDKYANRNITMLEALSLSDNIYAIKTTLLLGSHTIASFLNRFGIDIENVNPTIGLGSVSLSPLQLCSIYNTFASDGAYYPPVFYSKITLSNNNLLINNKETPSFYLNKQIVNVLSYLLLSPFDEGLVSYTSPSLLNYQTNVRFGAKTGSTSYCSWVVGYNPNYTICVWTGNDKNNENKNSNLSKVIFQKIANNLTYNSGDIYFTIPTKSKPSSLSHKEKRRTSNVYYTI